ncbi:MAG: fibronectin type III domain-containing protein [Deltaproteobacteria bacterium]|nr:fibronectin type III domain-containing protein [Deltaproteobacteria bacterium]
MRPIYGITIPALTLSMAVSGIATALEPPKNLRWVDSPIRDTVVPSSPGSLVASPASSSSIRLSWSASSDNVGVTAYLIFRGGNQVGTVPGTTFAYQDTGLSASTTYTYTVKARDAAGNVSANSNVATASTEPEGNTGHPFPFAFSDPQFFANTSASDPIDLSCNVPRSDLTITEHREPAAIINNCENGVATIRRVRLGGDGGTNGTVREGYRCGGSGTMNIEDTWLEAKGSGADHADVVQCYDPNNSPAATMNVKHTTIRAYTTSATAGIFVADSYALHLYLTDVLFWGGPYGLRVHDDGRPGSVHLNNVCFYGESETNNSFGFGAFLLDSTIAEWNNVNWCTIHNGQLVVHGPIPQP